MADPESWWNNLPPVTKFLFAGSFVLTIAANFGLLSFSTLLLDFTPIYYKFEIWRLVTAFLFHGKLGFPFLVNMLFLVQYGTTVEKEFFNNETADYLFMILFGCTCLLIPGYFVPLPILGLGLIMMIIYYWSRKINPDMEVVFIFGIRFKAVYLPWALLAFRVLLGGVPISEICGVLVGHLYHFLKEVYPAQGGPRLLHTPQFLKDWFPGPRHVRAAANPWQGRGYVVGGRPHQQ